MKLILQAIKALFRKIEASRTHWDTRKIVTKDYTFDGNIDGKETIQIREGTLLVKVDDTFPEVSSITNLSVVYTDISEGSVEEYELSLGDVSMEGDIYSFDGDAYYTPHGGEYEGVYIPSGLYFRYQIDVVYVSKLSVTYADGELKKLDIKYIPDEIREMPSKIDKQNPTGIGSFSLNRRTGTTIGVMSFAEGTYTTASGNYSHAEGNGTTASGENSHAEGWNTTASGNNSHAEGYFTTASGKYSHAEGNSTTASGENSHAEDYRTTALGSYSHAEGNSTNKFSSIVTATNPTDAAIIAAWKNSKFSLAKGTSSHVEGRDNLALSDYSHTEGYCTTASNTASHAEGLNTTASGYYSHAEGYNTTASNANSHAEGNYTTASGIYSHAEGSNTTASGQSSHAEGFFTKASGVYQHAQGKYSIEDSAGTYADIIGNGTSSKCSNAATVDWSGNAWYAGDVYVGSTSGTNKDAGSKKLATEEYVSAELENHTSDPSLGITNATVGQIAKITAVDSNGKPTAWEPVDLPTGDTLRLIVDTTTTEDVAQIEFTEDIDGNPLKLKKFIFSLEVPAATGVANATIGASDYRWYGGADTPKYSYYGGKTVQLSKSKTTWWGEICMNIEADGKYAIFYKRATNIPYSNNTVNSDGGTYHRLDVRYAPYSSGGGVYYFHETIDRIYYISGSTTVMIPTGTKIRIWGVDA